ncbi:uncharacterized protein LOC117930355 [Vitis riparia]|uniref:uncharacterized protein LOC117930355 n=1 Tax=Vitis riparia TaxID=96939 RepID=UPI00155AB65C|nr:uncharacterized protein LOC117930355 [Vitis riparia]
MFSLMMTMSRNRSYVEFGHISQGDGDLQVRRESNVKKISTVYSVDLPTMVAQVYKGTCNDLHLIPIQRCTCQNTYNRKWIRKSQKSCSSEEGSCGHSSLSVLSGEKALMPAEWPFVNGYIKIPRIIDTLKR